jgi:flagellar FliL protein
MLYSNQDPATLNSREGKEMLRTQTLEEVRKVLEEQTGEGGVENVYFTSFVMQ